MHWKTRSSPIPYHRPPRDPESTADDESRDSSRPLTSSTPPWKDSPPQPPEKPLPAQAILEFQCLPHDALRTFGACAVPEKLGLNFVYGTGQILEPWTKFCGTRDGFSPVNEFGALSPWNATLSRF
ncbi:hypothetical protein L596_027889 [Steinernema carpocapsae]|uniref:Uncharacterized protein n=1 Tax=Steinernema carpocapsae TaxID=34508 RepID=A0A4U5LWV9_STECR|nr:hypothetical protein L596_027889 [Steinernema carpocapsae]